VHVARGILSTEESQDRMKTRTSKRVRVCGVCYSGHPNLVMQKTLWTYGSDKYFVMADHVCLEFNLHAIVLLADRMFSHRRRDNSAGGDAEYSCQSLDKVLNVGLHKGLYVSGNIIRDR
jgi:hypothetical protein